MKGVDLLIPCSVRKSIISLTSWLELNRDVLAKDGLNPEQLQALLLPYKKLRSLEKSKNPYVVVELRWNGAYSNIEEDYLCKLSDWLFIGSCVDSFCLGDRAGKHSEVDCILSEHYTARWATDTEIEYMSRDKYYWSLFKGEVTPHYRDDSKEALKKAYAEWAKDEFDPEHDAVPVYNAFKETFDETMKSIPHRGVLDVKCCLDYGAKTYDNTPILEDTKIEFEDMRRAALMVATNAKIWYPKEYYKKPNINKEVDLGKGYKFETHFDDNYWGRSDIDWKPDARQWSQMQEECPPRCSWEKMLEYAQGVAKQKRLKKDLSLE